MSPFSAKNGWSSASVASAWTMAPPVPSGSASVIQVIFGIPVPRLDERIEHLLQVRGGQDHVVHVVAGQMIEHMVKRRTIHQRHQRLGHRLGQRPQPRPLASDQHHRLHPANLPLTHTISARARSAVHASGSVSFRHPAARCLR